MGSHGISEKILSKHIKELSACLTDRRLKFSEIRQRNVENNPISTKQISSKQHKRVYSMHKSENKITKEREEKRESRASQVHTYIII